MKKKNKNRRIFLKSTLSMFAFINLLPGMQKIFFDKYKQIMKKKNKDGIWILNSLDD
tara:strand:+ start:283 stop:453 length:171 start_codon:yes stop_codon:yes gene_type:complete